MAFVSSLKCTHRSADRDPVDPRLRNGAAGQNLPQRVAMDRTRPALFEHAAVDRGVLPGHEVAKYPGTKFWSNELNVNATSQVTARGTRWAISTTAQFGDAVSAFLGDTSR